MLVEPIEEGYQWFFSRELARPDARILVAEETGRILGYAYATLEARDWNDLLDACGKLNDLYVDAGAAAAGDRALVDATFAWFRERRAPRVVLLVPAEPRRPRILRSARVSANDAGDDRGARHVGRRRRRARATPVSVQTIRRGWV